MFLSNISIKRPVFTTMVIVGLMTLGVLAFRNLGVDLFPNVEFPIVTVITPYPGAGPEEVEQLVSKQVEEAVSSINLVDEVRSYSRDSVSTVVIVFKLEADVKSAANDVRDKMAGIRGKLPKEIKDPIIQRIDPTAVPILTYAVSSKRPSIETRRLVEDVIKPRVESIDGVASVNVYGGQERELHVFVKRAQIDALGIPLAQVSQQIAAESFDLPAGRVTAGEKELTVKTLGRFRSKEELEGMVVATLANGSQVKLREVADVVDGFKEQRTRTRLNGEDSVVFEIQKQGGTNTVAISDSVYKRLDELKTSNVLPADVKLVKALDASSFIRKNISDVTEAILFGGAMAILVIFLFMLDWRSTLISSLALPTSIVTTFLVMWWLGFSFNMMTLLGLSLAIGLLIDDAVVVRENIYRHMEKGEDPITAARNGTAEIGLAVMATTFTIVAVFVPVAFMGGMIGKFFKEFGLTVAAAVLVSLFVSFTLDPMMSARVVKAIQPGHHERLKKHPVYGPIVRFYDSLDASYRGLLKWALEHRLTVVIGAVVLFVSSMMLVPMMGKEFFAPGDRGEFKVALEAPAGTSLDEMDRITKEAEQSIRQNPEVRSLYTVIGPSEEANKASIRVYTTKSKERKITQTEIKEQLRQGLAKMPALRFSLSDVGMVDSGTAQELPVTLYVRGDDYLALQKAAGEALAAMKTVRGVKDPDMSYRAGKPETNIEVDRAKAADLGVSLGSIAMTARLALEGDVVAKFREGDRDYDVRLQLTPEDRRSLATVNELNVPVTGRKMGAAMAAGPRMLKIGEVAKINSGSGPATIERMNRQRQIILMSNTADRSLGEVVADLEAMTGPIAQANNVRFVFGGQTKNMKETFTNMLIALAVAILFIYFVLASQFESFIHPFTIMLALPLAIVGAFLLLFIADLPIGMPAMIGIILLMGLVTKNAILLVDYTNELRKKGKPMIEALLEAGPTRLRPILMTSAAMVLGMLPAAVVRGEGSEFRAPMSIAVIGGVITSTFLTLLVVPVVYTWMDRFTIKHHAIEDEEPAVKPLHPPKPAQAARDEAGESPAMVAVGDKP
jgi:hydrophobic/amphiphilic exporter-1 (mainly G- bacteria), HAE1 family